MVLVTERCCHAASGRAVCGSGWGWLEVAGVPGVGVVTPLARPGSLVVPDGERGDPGFGVLAGGEVAAARSRRSGGPCRLTDRRAASGDRRASLPFPPRPTKP